MSFCFARLSVFWFEGMAAYWFGWFCFRCRAWFTDLGLRWDFGLVFRFVS